MAAHNPKFEGEKMKKGKKGSPPKKVGRSAPRTRKKPFRLEVGKTYKNRLGMIRGPLVQTPSSFSMAKTHPFMDERSVDTYKPSGRYSYSHRISIWDLIREVPSAKPFRLVVTKAGKTPKSSPYAETHPHMTEMRVEMTGAKRPRSRKAKGSRS